MSKLKIAISLGLVVFALALFTPVLVNATEEKQTQNLRIGENRTTELTDALSVRSERVRPTQDTATIAVINTRSLNESQQQLNVTETKEYVVDGNSVNVTLNDAFEGDTQEISRLTVEYSPTFGWVGPASLFVENLGVVLVAISFMTVIGLILVVIRS